MDKSKHWTWRRRLRTVLMLAAAALLMALAPAMDIVAKYHWFH